MLSRLGSSSGTHALRRTAGLAPLQLARTLKSGAWIDKELGYDTCAAALSCCSLPIALCTARPYGALRGALALSEVPPVVLRA